MTTNETTMPQGGSAPGRPMDYKGCPNLPAMLFDEASVTAAEVRQEAQRPDAATASPLPRAKKPRGQHPGREPLPAHLERREITLHCHPDDCRCRQCGAQRPVIGYETREELGCEPAKFFVKVIKREKRGSHCPCTGATLVPPWYYPGTIEHPFPVSKQDTMHRRLAASPFAASISLIYYRERHLLASGCGGGVMQAPRQNKLRCRA